MPEIPIELKDEQCSERSYGGEGKGIIDTENCRISGTDTVLIFKNKRFRGITGNTPRAVADQLAKFFGLTKEVLQTKTLTI